MNRREKNILAFNEDGFYLQDQDGEPIDFVDSVKIKSSQKAGYNAEIVAVFLFPLNVAKQRISYLDHVQSFIVTDGKGQDIPHQVDCVIENYKDKIKVTCQYIYNSTTINPALWREELPQ